MLRIFVILFNIISISNILSNISYAPHILLTTVEVNKPQYTRFSFKFIRQWSPNNCMNPKWFGCIPIFTDPVYREWLIIFKIELCQTQSPVSNNIWYIPQLPIKPEYDLHTVLNMVLVFFLMNRGNAVMLTPFRSRNTAPQK